MLPETLAEIVFLALLAWGVYRALEPLRRRFERLILRWLDPAKAPIVDAEIVPNQRRRPKE